MLLKQERKESDLVSSSTIITCIYYEVTYEVTKSLYRRRKNKDEEDIRNFSGTISEKSLENRSKSAAMDYLTIWNGIRDQ